MPNTTDEWWSITDPDTGEEVSLAQEGWNIVTFGGARYDLPPLRGDNQAFAYLPGQEHHEKYADSRTISLRMWVVGTRPDGTFSSNQIVQLNDNWARLRKLVWRPHGSQIILTRRWKLTNPQTGLPEIQTAQAEAQIANNMEPTATGRTRLEFDMDFLLADPYFYLPEVEVTIPFNTPTVVHNPGDDIVMYKHFQVDFNGNATGDPLANPRLTNDTSNPDVWFRFERKIPDVANNILATTVTFDIEDYQIIPEYLPISFVVHSGSRRWFKLERGNNLITLTGDGAGTGTATLRFRPPVI